MNVLKLITNMTIHELNDIVIPFDRNFILSALRTPDLNEQFRHVLSYKWDEHCMCDSTDEGLINTGPFLVNLGSVIYIMTDTSDVTFISVTFKDFDGYSLTKCAIFKIENFKDYSVISLAIIDSDDLEGEGEDMYMHVEMYRVHEYRDVFLPSGFLNSLANLDLGQFVS